MFENGDNCHEKTSTSKYKSEVYFFCGKTLVSMRHESFLSERKSLPMFVVPGVEVLVLLHSAT